MITVSPYPVVIATIKMNKKQKANKGTCWLWRYCRAADDRKAWELVPLIPEYRRSEHEGYVKTIDAALKNSKIRNIALSGGYGVGKSSILQKVAEKYKKRVVELSLSTLTPIGEKTLSLSGPEHATTPTNQIQKEIVKQLLYSEEPYKTPGSRFRRIEPFKWRREAVWAFIAGLVIMVVFLLTGWTRELATEFRPWVDLGLGSHPFVFGVAASVAYIVRYLLHGRIHIRQLSTGAATVTLDDKSMSYFDQYLDEIVYFFKVSRRDIVIFEDIDRFNDALIFETLRSLNTLLNASRPEDAPIRFIYAVKDSIFEQTMLLREVSRFEQDSREAEDSAQAEVVGANRTKFFDIVIPVVPFINHNSARNLAIQLFKEIDNKIDAELIDLASRYIPDMRLLKNVRNEFVVFRDRIFSGDGEQLALSENGLFAMMLYKSTHLSDFEAIRLGRSKLDQIYKIARDVIGANIKTIQIKRQNIDKRLAHNGGFLTQSAQLGDQLIAHVKRTIRAAGYQDYNGKYSFKGNELSEDGLRGSEFWLSFMQAKNEPQLHWSNPYRGQILSFSRSDIAEALSVCLDSEYWTNQLRKELKTALGEYDEDLKFLRRADMGDLIKRQDFKIEHNGSEQSFDSIARELLGEGLAYQLICKNYINRNFTLYTATFHGDRVSAAAMNFIIHHVERDNMDEHFELSGDDVEAVIREVGKSALSNPALYNIAILDHLLSTDADTADIMIGSLVRFGADEKRFLQSYLNNGVKQEALIERVTAISEDILVYLVNQVDLDEKARLKLVSVALASLADDVDYQIDPPVSKYLAVHYAELPALTSTSLGELEAERIARVFLAADIQVPELEPLSEAARQAFVAQDLYAINRENLVIALGSDTNLALDTARAANKGVFAYILQNLGAYLSAIDGTSATVAAGSNFITVVEHVLAADDSQLGEVIARASESCIVADLADVSESAWPFLAKYERFPATFSNVNRYIRSIGAVDAYLAITLNSASGITEHETSEEEEKQQIATMILAARDWLPASHRVELVRSLKLQRYLDVEEIEVENGELFALLLKHNIIEDDATTYAHLSGTNWLTRELVIGASTKFKDYITPALLKGDLAALLLSAKVDPAIKASIAACAGEYVEGSSKKDLAQLAQFATQHQHQLSLDVVEKLASSGVPSKDVIVLLEPHLQVLSSEQLFGILRSLGGDYPKLTSVGTDRPTVPNTPANRALLEVLKRHGIVSKYTPDAERIRVFKRRKFHEVTDRV